MEKFRKDMTLGEALRIHPDARKVFEKYGVHCVGCPASMMETIAQGAMMHGLDVNKLLEELNSLGEPARG